MDTLPTNAPPLAARSPATLRRLSSVIRPLSSVFLPLAVFSVLWIDLIRQLSYQWSTNEQYAYGWFVPFLALGLLLKKWPDRPAPCPPSSVIRHPSSAPSSSNPIPAFSFHPSALPVQLFAFSISAFKQGAHLRKFEAMNWQALPATDEDLIAARAFYGNVHWRQEPDLTASDILARLIHD